MDGLEVTERIKARCPWTPVVVITGYGTQANEVRASVLGASGFVRKPLTPEMIESITLKAVNDSAATADVIAAPEDLVEVETVTEAEVPKAKNSIAKNIGLFFASPFIALGYVIALPIVGFYMFVKLGREAFIKKHMSE
jgi:DNA-binding NtrC family response regulator